MNRSKENTWRLVQGKTPVRPMADVVADLKHYVETYDRQPGYENYDDFTYIEDILYGLGKSLGEEYEYALGLNKFKERLLKHLHDTIQEPDSIRPQRKAHE